MPKITKGFKVLNQGKSSHIIRHEVIYSKNRWTWPKIKGSLLFCFQTYFDAENFIGALNNSLQIVPCLILDGRPLVEMAATEGGIKEYWEKFDNKTMQSKAKVKKLAIWRQVIGGRAIKCLK